jgi:hypothetical protein
MCLINSEEELILICLFSNNDIEQLKIRLCEAVFHTELKSCVTFIESIREEKIFVVISPSFTSEILFLLPHLEQIECIFIYCSKTDDYEYSLIEHPKIINICDNLDLLCSSIKEQIDFINQQHHRWTFFDRDYFKTKDLSKQSSDFIWIHLFRHVILHLRRDEQAKQQMIDSCRQHYQGNEKDLQLIDEFEDQYESTDVIHFSQKFLTNHFKEKIQINFIY